MSLNKWIHPRNPYKTPPDFKQLAVKYPTFRKFVTQDLKGKLHLDFKNAAALRCLTTTLLQQDFDLCVDLPENSLVPTLTLRMNYLLWIQDILRDQDAQTKLSGEVKGLDIGTGASCIYPLLAAKHFNWKMVASESDQFNYDHAVKNVNNNKLTSEISIRKVGEDVFIKDVLESEEIVHFSMCNPPFFDEEAKDGDSDNEPGKPNELYTGGGEVRFVTNMATDSKMLGERVAIFTTMLGHKSSLAPIKKMLDSLGVCSRACSELCQGKTMRWTVAWTFTPGLDLNKVKGTKAKKEQQKKVFSWSVEGGRHLPEEQQKATDLLKKIKEWLAEIQVDVVVSKETKHLCRARLTAAQATWRGQRRKRRAEKKSRDIKDLMTNKSQVDLGLGNDGSPGYEKFSEVGDEPDQEESDLSTVESCLLEEMGGKSVHSKEKKEDIPPSMRDAAPELLCDMVIRWTGPSVKLDMSFISGSAGKEGMHQLLQFLKNKQSSNK